jgi:hypothetical protein
MAKYGALRIVRQQFVFEELVRAGGLKCNLEATYYSAFTPVSYVVLWSFHGLV